LTVSKLAPLLVVLSSLTGCSGLFHSDARPEQVYYLRTQPVAPGAAPQTPVAASLRFNRPTASPGLDSTQIVLVESDRRMSFFSASRWPAPASALIEMLAVEKLRGSGLWQSVADSTGAFPTDYVLLVTVRRFEADYTNGATSPEVRVVLDCIIGKRENREVLASFIAEGTVAATANKMSAVVAAFESATNVAIDSLQTQSLDVVRKSLGH
jgi:cholesterol transport system auxiliary component